MKIGIDARAAAEVPAGRGRYVRELLGAIGRSEAAHDFLLYARSRWPSPSLDERFQWRLVNGRDPLWHIATARRASSECDVYLSTNSYLTVWFTRIPAVAVVFDMITFDRRLAPQRRATAIERATLRLAVRRAAALLAASESTRNDLVDRYKAAGPKTRVVHLAADESFTPEGDDEGVLQRYALRKPYVLVTGTLEPRKNLPRLVEAFAGLPAELVGRYELVLVGPTGWEMDETLASIAKHKGSARAIGYVPDEHLPALYRRAELFCYPSLYEGFGLPVLEAMQCGTAVVTSGLSSLPEVGGDAVAYVDPLDVEDIRRALAELLFDAALRERYAARGVARAKLYSWRATAEGTLAALESVAR